MGFLNKVEAAITKPTKINKKKAPKSMPSEGAPKGEKVAFTELTNTRKLIPFIQKELQYTDPFNFTNETWARFIKNVVPKLLPMLLLDMGIVPKGKRAEFIRYLDRRLKALPKT